MSPYLFGHDWEQERRRLGLLEQIYDPGTRALLARLPLPAGAHCLEVGGQAVSGPSGSLPCGVSTAVLNGSFDP